MALVQTKKQRFESVTGAWFFIIVLSKNAVACEGCSIHFFDVHLEKQEEL